MLFLLHHPLKTKFGCQSWRFYDPGSCLNFHIWSLKSAILFLVLNKTSLLHNPLTKLFDGYLKIFFIWKLIMNYSKWKKTREGALSRLVQQVTKNGEKETESEAVKGETLEQILEGWKAGDSHTETSEKWERFKKQINLNWRVNRAVESGPCKLAVEVLNTSKVLIILSRCSWLQMQELAHTAGIPHAKLQGSDCQGCLSLGIRHRKSLSCLWQEPCYKTWVP